MSFGIRKGLALLTSRSLPTRSGGVKAHRDKVAYYEQPDIPEWLHQATGESNISFSAVVANWRGVLSPLNAEFLKSVLKLLSSGISLLSLRICEETSRIHRFFHSSTLRTRVL